MSKKPVIRKPTKEQLEFERMIPVDADQDRGKSQLPSDNASSLNLDEVEWRWIDAVYVAEQDRNPQRLITLLGQERVPPRVMPIVRLLLEQRLGRTIGRPKAILPTRKEISYHLAQEQVRELVEAGATVADAARILAAKWGLSVKALTHFCYGNSGYARTTKSKRP